MARNVIRCTLAGTWYPADPETLRGELQSCLDRAEGPARADVIGLISPHAGYAYSGVCAAQGVSRAGGTYRRIVVIGPTHRFALRNRFSVPDVEAIETPLGTIPVDREAVAALLSSDLFVSQPEVLRGENSIELQLPLLQVRFGDFAVVPIAAGLCDEATIRAAGAALRALTDDTTLIVASGDFTHYGPSFNYVPFTEDIPDRLKALDMGAWDPIQRGDVAGFLAYLDRTGATICGRTSIAVLLAALPTGVEACLADYRSSGALTGDFQNSVSYLAAVFTGSWQAEPCTAAELPDADRQTLLDLARRAIAFALERGRSPEPQDLGVVPTGPLGARRAAFVTLHQGAQLRGCIGEILPTRSLCESVIGNAVNAALQDPRFPAVTAAELPGLGLEISALTPPAPVDSWRRIRIGTDGVVLRKGGRSAVFLPQVAPEQGWDLDTTLSYLARKAGLPADAWREGAEFLTFQAEVFGESR